MNAFTGYLPHATPMSSVKPSPLYAMWLSACKHKNCKQSWPEYRDQQAGKAQAPAAAKKKVLTVESAKPMPWLSKRAQELLVPNSTGYCTPIEPAGSAIKRLAKTKAAI